MSGEIKYFLVAVDDTRVSVTKLRRRPEVSPAWKRPHSCFLDGTAGQDENFAGGRTLCELGIWEWLPRED